MVPSLRPWTPQRGKRLTTKTFWMVWVNNKAAPLVRHDNLVDAIREAGRLAQKTNAETFVLQSVGVAEPRVEVDFKEIKCD